MKRDLRLLRDSLMDITGVLNRHQPDEALLALAGVDLDRALFPVLARVERLGPLGIGELAELCGRDHTTISRQVSRLEEIGLVARRTNRRDARMSHASVTRQGRGLIKSLEAGREKILRQLFSEWEREEVADLARLLRKFADEALAFVRTEHRRQCRSTRNAQQSR